MKKGLIRGLILILGCIIILVFLPIGTMATNLTDENERTLSPEILNTATIEPEKTVESSSNIINSLEELPEISKDLNVDQQIVVIYASSSENNLKSLALNSNDIKSGEQVSDRVDILETKNDITTDQLISELEANPDVLAVGRNGTIQVAALPNDPYIQNGDAWQFKNIGADKTWDQVANTEPIVVAVIDSGLNESHPDLQGKIVEGYDYVNKTIDVVDVSGHGTMVSGCIAAVTNNEIGIAGVCGTSNIKIAPYRTGGKYSGDMSLDLAYICAAIMAASDRSDVKVINMSFGGYDEYPTLQTAIEYAAHAGKVLVASAGNEGSLSGYAGKYSYPSSYKNVVSVAATTSEDGRASFSQYNDQVDLCAPGKTICTTTIDGSYAVVSGTSFSAPIVAGSCAVLIAANSNLAALEVENILKDTALDLGDTGKDNYYGKGRIQLDKAIQAVLPPLEISGFSTDIASGQEVNTNIQLSAEVSGGQSPYEYKFYYQFNGSTVILNDFSTSNLATFVPTQSGIYTLYVEVKDADGTKAMKTISDYLIIDKMVYATNITLNKMTANMIVGASEKIIATLTPVNVTDKTIIWSSSDTSIVTVDGSGNVKGIKIGKAVITAKTSNNLTSTCSMTVTSKPMTASAVAASISGNKITATIKGINAPNGVKQILVPIWSDINGQDDIRWCSATKKSDGSYSITIDIKDHNYDSGLYHIHVYGTDNNNKMTFLGNTTVTLKPMTASAVAASISGNKITATIKGINAPNGVKQILVPIWSAINGQDDIRWYSATKKSDGSYSVTMDIKDHNYDSGLYHIHVYGIDNNNKMTFLGNTTVNVKQIQ
ncbi:GBS Bsp-like repeat-containing protein [Acetobacterium sp.]|uniref:GBS Bsp-like repeat-containing protein n=1 Tax=Acetobacterium sp. TaxID=1872094 RepID=UPI002F42769F